MGKLEDMAVGWSIIHVDKVVCLISKYIWKKIPYRFIKSG